LAVDTTIALLNCQYNCFVPCLIHNTYDEWKEVQPGTHKNYVNYTSSVVNIN